MNSSQHHRHRSKITTLKHGHFFEKQVPYQDTETLKQLDSASILRILVWCEDPAIAAMNVSSVILSHPDAHEDIAAVVDIILKGYDDREKRMFMENLSRFID
jgi:hypothetical protein